MGEDIVRTFMERFEKIIELQHHQGEQLAALTTKLEEREKTYNIYFQQLADIRSSVTSMGKRIGSLEQWNANNQGEKLAAKDINARIMGAIGIIISLAIGILGVMLKK